MSLRHRLAGCSLALAALFAFAPLQASAATHLETSAFSFDSSSPGRADKLVADADGATTISLLGARDALAYAPPQSSQYEYYQHLYQGVFQIDVRPGYRMTGYSLTGAWLGDYYVGQVPDYPNIMLTSFPYASANGGMTIRADLPAGSGGSGAPLSSTASSLSGTSPFVLDSGALDHTGAFKLYVEGFGTGEASPALWWYMDYNDWGGDFSRARIELGGPLLLTVYTQAVPEPHAYALTLAGLALVGGAARRRRRLPSSPLAVVATRARQWPDRFHAQGRMMTWGHPLLPPLRWPPCSPGRLPARPLRSTSQRAA